MHVCVSLLELTTYRKFQMSACFQLFREDCVSTLTYTSAQPCKGLLVDCSVCVKKLGAKMTQAECESQPIAEYLVASLLQVCAVNEQQASQLIHSRNLANGLSLVHARVA